MHSHDDSGCQFQFIIRIISDRSQLYIPRTVEIYFGTKKLKPNLDLYIYKLHQCVETLGLSHTSLFSEALAFV
jgi:hypothetical protein